MVKDYEHKHYHPYFRGRDIRSGKFRADLIKILAEKADLGEIDIFEIAKLSGDPVVKCGLVLDDLKKNYHIVEEKRYPTRVSKYGLISKYRLNLEYRGIEASIEYILSECKKWLEFDAIPSIDADLLLKEIKKLLHNHPATKKHRRIEELLFFKG